jgi:putative tricarboxylic transport membrane protein
MADRVIFVCTLILAGVYFYATEKLPSLEIGDPLGPKAFPRLLGILLVITAIILLVEMIRGRKVVQSDVPSRGVSTIGSSMVVAAVVVWTFLYFLVFELLGYVVATAIYLLVLMAYFHRHKWTSNVVTAVLFSLISYLMFTKLLGVNLAPGILPF